MRISRLFYIASGVSLSGLVIAGGAGAPVSKAKPLSTVQIHGSRLVEYDSLDSLEAASDLIVIGSTNKDFIDQKHVTTYHEDGSLEGFYTDSSFLVSKVIKSPANSSISAGSLITVRESAGIVEDKINPVGKKVGNQKVLLDEYTELKKNSEYIVFLKSNPDSTYSIINLDEGKFNLDGKDKEDNGKKGANKNKIRKEIDNKYKK